MFSIKSSFFLCIKHADPTDPAADLVNGAERFHGFGTGMTPFVVAIKGTAEEGRESSASLSLWSSTLMPSGSSWMPRLRLILGECLGL